MGVSPGVSRSINTAAYIAEMLPQLEKMARDLTDEPLREQVDLQGDLLDSYFNTVSAGIRALVSGEYGKVEALLFGMTSVNWATFMEIGDQSRRRRGAGKRRIYHECLQRALRGVPRDSQPSLEGVLPELLRPLRHALPTAVLGLCEALQASQ